MAVSFNQKNILMTNQFFKIKTFVRLFTLISFVFIFLNNNLNAQVKNKIKGATLTHAYLMGKTSPLRDLATAAPTLIAKRKTKKENIPDVNFPPNFMGYEGNNKLNPHALPKGEDQVRQKDFAGTGAFPVLPNLVIEGIDQTTSLVGVPDPNGDVSADHYIQMVNASFFQIFDKAGNALTVPITANTIWNEIGYSSFSDPIIHYDVDADRWFISDLANIDQVLYGVSETNDPMGSWFVYTYLPLGFTDYPKYGIWPEAYILSVNAVIGDSSPVFAINRGELLAGQPVVAIQSLNIPNIPDGGLPTVTPIGWSGTEPTAANAKPCFVRIHDDAWGNINQDQVEIWTMSIDWDNPANSTLEMQPVNTASFDSQPCSIGNNSGFDECIPQPGATGLDGIVSVVMNKVSYYDYGTHEAFAMAFTVDTGNNIAGIRWMEIRRDAFNGSWELYQEGTFAPTDGLHRFIPSISLNSQGHMGLGYAVSSSTKFASLRYTGRLASDLLGEMTVDEFEFAEGQSAFTQSFRYGDYACMSVDPIDDSFWFTHEYVLENGSWGTKIVNYDLRRDSLDLAVTGLVAPLESPDLTDSEFISVEFVNLGFDTVFDFSVGYIFENNQEMIEPASIDTFLPGANYEHTFNTTVDMSAVRSYEIQVFSILPNDQFVRNDTLRNFVRKLPRFDTGITGTLGLAETVCDSTVEVAFAVTNFGTENITSLQINYRINGGTINSFDYNTFLLPENSVFATTTLSGLSSGVNHLEVFSSLPNGMTDELLINDTLKRNFQVVVDGTQVFFELTTDHAPTETTWQLTDDQGNVFYTGGPYSSSFTTYTEDWCLEEGACYELLIMDSSGDGLQSSSGAGDYVIKAMNGSELASLINPNFGFAELHPFCVVECEILSIDISFSNESTSNANDGTILVSPLSGNAPFRYSIDAGQTFQDSPIFEGLTAGEYTVIVQDSLFCETSTLVVISTLVSNQQEIQRYNLSIFPNPSNNGVFKIETEGQASTLPYLQIQILNSQGQPVMYKKLTRLNSGYTGLLSLHAFPAGIYFVRFMDERVHEVVKLVKQ
ncbi:MAG: T9SS type A sorting domain-containing protein [Bacteroidota bacterium]